MFQKNQKRRCKKLVKKKAYSESDVEIRSLWTLIRSQINQLNKLNEINSTINELSSELHDSGGILAKRTNRNER